MSRILGPLMLALFIAAGGCGDDRRACDQASDCESLESCVWLDGESVCARRCANDDECPSGQECSGQASSCEVCLDVIAVCE